MPQRIPQPIKAGAHGAIDYGFTVVNLIVPSLLGLRGAAARIPRAFAFVQGGLNAVTDQPYAVRPMVPLRTHGWIELATIPATGAYSARAGALKTRRGKLFFALSGAALGTVYSLTDWNDPAGNPGKGPAGAGHTELASPTATPRPSDTTPAPTIHT